MSRFIILFYGVVAYLTFLLTFLYAMGFMGNFLVPKSIDSGAEGPLIIALLINIGLLSVFAVQHSVMARPAFKTWWTKIIPKAAERSTYTLLSSLALILLFYYWQPIGGIVWQVEGSVGRIILYSLFGFGWALVLVSTFLINHFDLFGLQQVWFNFKDKPEPAPNYTERLFYKIVRHPLQMGFLMGLWITPTMSWTLFTLSTFMTIYIFIGLHYEEKDLVVSLGDSYVDYQKRVRKLIPIPK